MLKILDVPVKLIRTRDHPSMVIAPGQPRGRSCPLAGPWIPGWGARQARAGLRQLAGGDDRRLRRAERLRPLGAVAVDRHGRNDARDSRRERTRHARRSLGAFTPLSRPPWTAWPSSRR